MRRARSNRSEASGTACPINAYTNAYTPRRERRTSSPNVWLVPG